MRNPLKRYYGHGDLHYVTFSCHRRQPLLGTSEARDVFVRVLDEIRCRHGFLLIGYVVMPEHVHLLVSEPVTGDPSRALQVVKQNVSKMLGQGRRSTATPLWQRRFYDFNVWSEGKLKEKLEYMHANPMKRKLVTDLMDWPWSSWGFYEKGEHGLIRIDVLKPGLGESQRPHP